MAAARAAAAVEPTSEAACFEHTIPPVVIVVQVAPATLRDILSNGDIKSLALPVSGKVV
jgi:hypothetical protein